VLMTGNASLESSILALRHGAADYLLKPVSMPQLESVLSRVMKPAQSPPHPADLHAELQRTGRFGPLVGRSGRMELLYEQIVRVARTSVPVFIKGETGTGKELAARTVHELSRRRDSRFAVMNCALPPLLLEGALFGAGDQPGLLADAKGGSLFLDDICAMPGALQARLLRALEDGADVRLLSATSRDPAAAIAAGALREDLFYRLCVFPIEMPPLRERVEDLPLLAAHLLREIGRREGVFRQATPAALQRLAQYRWPGNVRELRNALEQSYVMASGREITHPWLPRDGAAPAPVVQRENTFEVAAGTTLAQVEREVILATLARCGGHKERTAHVLGISPKTLYTRLKQYGA